jgi:hypothetical protein
MVFMAPSIVPQTLGDHPEIEEKPLIKVAVIFQRWDILDVPARIIMAFYRHHLNQAESEYNVTIRTYTFWDRWNGGAVQRGLLRKYDIDVVIAPGGFGGWNTPREYRQEILRFVRSGGGFYGICGDSTFGSLGPINLPDRYEYLLRKVLGYRDLTPMLGLANVYTDASVFNDLIKRPFFYGRNDMLKTVLGLPFSRSFIYVLPSDLPILEPYYRDRVRVMMGNAPLVDGSKIRGLFMPEVSDIAIFKGTDHPYDRSIVGKKAIIATRYWKGRVILSAPHPELTVENTKAHDIFVRNVLWLAGELPYFAPPSFRAST